jgi:hypothetical protein
VSSEKYDRLDFFLFLKGVRGATRCKDTGSAALAQKQRTFGDHSTHKRALSVRVELLGTVDVNKTAGDDARRDDVARV